MDLVSNPDESRVIVTLRTLCGKRVSEVRQKEKAIPITSNSVSKIVTDLVVFGVDRKAGELGLVELVEGVTLGEAHNLKRIRVFQSSSNTTGLLHVTHVSGICIARRRSSLREVLALCGKLQKSWVYLGQKKFISANSGRSRHASTEDVEAGQ